MLTDKQTILIEQILQLRTLIEFVADDYGCDSDEFIMVNSKIEEVYSELFEVFKGKDAIN